MESRNNKKLDQEAADWIVRLFDPDEDQMKTKEECLSWLMSSPQHKRAFRQIAEVSYALGLLDRSRRIDVQELIDRGSPDVIQLGFALEIRNNAGRPSWTRWLRRRLAV